MTGATLDGMISSRNSSRLARAARARRTTVASWSAFIAGVVVGVVEAEHLDHVLERPLGERAAVVGLDLEPERAGAGVLDRAADPEAGAGGGVERVAAEPAVAEQAVAGAAGGDLLRRPRRQSCLKAPMRSRGCAELVGDASRAACGGRRRRPASPASRRRRLVDQWICSSSASLRSAGVRMPRSRKKLQLLPRRVGRGAAVARDGEGAAGVGVLERGRPVLVGEPALEQAGHEAVAGAEHVEDLDREAGAALAVVEAVGDGAGEGGGAHRRRACRRGWRRRRRGRRGAPRWCRSSRRRCGTPPRCRRSGRRGGAWTGAWR